jgi:hypothetical protein
MPSLHDPALDERFDDLAAQIRGARPRAAEPLRQRVAETASRGVPLTHPRRRLRLAPALVLVALLAVAAVVALATRPDGGVEAEQGAGGGDAAVSSAAQDSARAAAAPESLQAQPPATLPPATSRLQLYRAQLTIRVGSVAELNAATRRAIRAARGLGGFVVSADLRTPATGDAVSRLVLRVPTTKAQVAYERFAGIGTLVSQRVLLDDLQAGVNRRNEAIDEVRERIAALERRAAAGEDVAAALAAARAELRQQQDAIAETTRRGRLATFTLTLTTADPARAPEPDGELEHAAREAFDLLRNVAAAALYPLILGAPLVLLGTLVWLVARRTRRRRDERLLGG